MPLSRGNLVVHGDVPRRSVAEADRVSVCDSETTDARELVFQEDELPPPATTRNLVSRFRSMEDPSREPPTPETQGKKLSASRRSVSLGSSNVSQHGHDEDHLITSNGDGTEYAAESGEFENNPVYNADVVRESDRTDNAEMPEQGTTQGLLAKFLAKFQNKQ